MSGFSHTSSGGSGPGKKSLDMVQMRRWLRVLFPIRSSPRRIALGVSIGVLIAFSPSIGFQMGLALVVASILNASRVAAVGCVWLTNPLTMGPVFAFTYAVGRPFWFTAPDLGLSELSQTIGGGDSPLSVGAVFNAFQNIYSLGPEVVAPMLIGGLITGGVAGGLCYIPAKSIASYTQKLLRRRSRAARRGIVGGSNTSLRHGVKPISVLRSDTNSSRSRRRAA